jgi:hypothetical protein
VWTVTTRGDLPDEFECREHETFADAWNDFKGRILELEIDGFTRSGGTRLKTGWVSDLCRGQEHITVTIERAAERGPPEPNTSP